MGCSVRFAGNPGRAKDGPIERLTGQNCCACGEGQTKTRRVESAGEVGRVAAQPARREPAGLLQISALSRLLNSFAR